MRVLLVEDNSDMARSIERMLRLENINVYTTGLGEEAIDLGKLYEYDIIILDLQLPDMSGFEVLKIWRADKVHTPVLILSGNNTVEAKIRGLNEGADDYITKPFHKDELIARLRAVVRRAKGHARNILTVGKIVMDTINKTVEINGLEVAFPKREYRLLETLMLNADRMRTREQLLTDMNDEGVHVEMRTLDVHLSRVRIKLGKVLKDGNYIETVRGHGYLFHDPSKSAENQATQ